MHGRETTNFPGGNLLVKVSFDIWRHREMGLFWRVNHLNFDFVGGGHLTISLSIVSIEYRVIWRNLLLIYNRPTVLGIPTTRVL
jgi:hypothetical protein